MKVRDITIYEATRYLGDIKPFLKQGLKIRQMDPKFILLIYGEDLEVEEGDWVIWDPDYPDTTTEIWGDDSFKHYFKECNHDD